MKKHELKNIRDIAAKLPVVREQHCSGYIKDEYGARVPNLYITEVNHVRRMKRAYEKTGIDGIKQYLEFIHQLQLKRNANRNNEPRESNGIPESPILEEVQDPVESKDEVTA